MGLNEVKELKPSESHCHICDNFELVPDKKSKGIILTPKKIIKDVDVLTAVCPRCNFKYWCQDWKTGVLNVNNTYFVSIELLVLIRSSIKKYSNIHSILETLELTYGFDNGLSFNRDAVTKAYFMFDALSSAEHQFFCYHCGDYPKILNFDVVRGAAFPMPHLNVDGMSSNNNQDKVNAVQFWRNIFLLAIADGVRGQFSNPYKLDLSYFNWAPWIPERMRESEMVFNTEYKKCSSQTNDVEADLVHHLSEERLDELIFNNASKTQLEDLCADCGIEGAKKMTKGACINALRSALKANSQIDNFFSKLWG